MERFMLLKTCSVQTCMLFLTISRPASPNFLRIYYTWANLLLYSCIKLLSSKSFHNWWTLNAFIMFEMDGIFTICVWYHIHTQLEAILKLKVYMEKHKSFNKLFKDSTKVCWFVLLSHIKINIKTNNVVCSNWLL